MPPKRRPSTAKKDAVRNLLQELRKDKNNAQVLDAWDASVAAFKAGDCLKSHKEWQRLESLLCAHGDQSKAPIDDRLSSKAHDAAGKIRKGLQERCYLHNRRG